MRKLAVLTDSACDIKEEYAKSLDIDILNFTISLDGKSYEERVDFTIEEYYEMLRNCEGMPSTAHITTIRFLEKFCEYDDKNYTDIVYITINKSGSNTHDAAVMAANQLKEERPNSKLRIYIVDSHTYSMGYGYFVCEAARLLKNGADLQMVLEKLEDSFASCEIVLSVFTLKFIKKSGRISAAAAFAGELLGLRPVISMIDGVTKVENKVRGDKNVLPAMINYANKRRVADSKYMVGTTNDENGAELAKLCKKQFGMAPECVFNLGAAISTNTGPDAVAIIFMGEKRKR